MKRLPLWARLALSPLTLFVFLGSLPLMLLALLCGSQGEQLCKTWCNFIFE